MTVLVQAALDSFLGIVAYALGMAALLVLVSALVATAQARAISFLKQLLPALEKASGVVLILVGVYLVNYWAGLVLYPHF